MSRTVLITGPELATDAMNLAAAEGVRIIPTTPYLPADELQAIIQAEQPDAIIVRPVSYTHLTLPTILLV